MLKSNTNDLAPVLFDYDGVVSDSLDIFYAALCEVFQRQNFPPPVDREAFLRLLDVNFCEGLAESGIPPEKIGKILSDLGDRLARDGQGAACFPDMPCVVTRLARRRPVYVITSNLSAVVESGLKRYGVEGVRSVLGSDREPSKTVKIRGVRHRHPGPPPFYVGDTVGDMLEARAAGARPLAVGWGWHAPDRLHRAAPDALFRTPDELLCYFGAHG